MNNKRSHYLEAVGKAPVPENWTPGIDQQGSIEGEQLRFGDLLEFQFDNCILR